MIATICEDGNGRYPVAGDYLTGDDGELYRVVDMGPRIVIGQPGTPNHIPGCAVELVDWSDCPEGSESRCRVREVQS